MRFFVYASKLNLQPNKTLEINKQGVCYFTFLIQIVKGCFYFFKIYDLLFKFLVLRNNIQNRFKGEVFPSKAKKQQIISIKTFYSNISYGFEYENLHK